MADCFLQQFSYENDMIFLGDPNADLGSAGGSWLPLV